MNRTIAIVAAAALSASASASSSVAIEPGVCAVEVGLTPATLVAAGAAPAEVRQVGLSLVSAEPLRFRLAADRATIDQIVAGLTELNRLAALRRLGEPELARQAALRQELDVAKAAAADTARVLRAAVLAGLDSSVVGRVEAQLSSLDRNVPPAFRVLVLSGADWSRVERLLKQTRAAGIESLDPADRAWIAAIEADPAVSEAEARLEAWLSAAYDEFAAAATGR